MKKPKYHLFICSSSRANGQQKGFCHSKGSVDMMQAFMDQIEEQGITDDVMVTNTGCMGICGSGPVAVVYPEGTWYGKFELDDVAEIVEQHFVNGTKVERLEIK